jgi:hypothetical protein
MGQPIGDGEIGDGEIGGGESVAGGLSDRSVLLALQELAEEIGADVAGVAADSDDAAALVAALLDGAGLPRGAVDTLGSAAAATAAARRLLAHTLHDPDTAEPAGQIVADPPADEQMSVEAAVAAAVVLGALVAWLQTKVDIKVSRKDGKNEFEFRMTKAATGPAGIRRIAEVVSALLTGTQPPP